MNGKVKNNNLTNKENANLFYIFALWKNVYHLKMETV